MLKVNPATAWRLLHGFGTLEDGSWIVQNVGNSAVGRCVIQLARDLGIRTISFVRRAEVIDELRALGADQVFLDDEAGLAAAKEVLGGANAALAFNAVGGDSALRLMKLLRESGSHITYGAMGRKPVTIPNGLLIFRDIQVRGLWVSRWIENAPREELDAGLRKPAGSDRFPGRFQCRWPQPIRWHDFKEALEQVADGARNGKILFVP